MHFAIGDKGNLLSFSDIWDEDMQPDPDNRVAGRYRRVDAHRSFHDFPNSLIVSVENSKVWLADSDELETSMPLDLNNAYMAHSLFGTVQFVPSADGRFNLKLGTVAEYIRKT